MSLVGRVRIPVAHDGHYSQLFYQTMLSGITSKPGITGLGADPRLCGGTAQVGLHETG